MNCYIFDVHIGCCFYHNNSRYDLLELGPLNMINSNLLIRISTILQGISSHDVPRNWWTDFSSWSDLRALLRTGTLLPIHRVLHECYLPSFAKGLHSSDYDWICGSVFYTCCKLSYLDSDL